MSIKRIEEIIGQTVRRDISRMALFAEGHLERAARSIMTTPKAHIGIVTGFFIRNAIPPSPETDGLGGMAHLAAGLANAGIRVTVISDAPCSKAVWAISTELPGSVALEITSVSEDAVLALRDRLAADAQPITHLIAIERVSPGRDGKPHREYGADMTADTAPLHLLFEDAGWERPWTTIGIGDGGNEIGMGALPSEIVRDDIPNGPIIAATTATDHLIVAGVSNWGGWGLLLAMAMAEPTLSAALLKDFQPQKDHAFLVAAVEVGQAVDDSRIDKPARPTMSVDRLPLQMHADKLLQLRNVTERYLAGMTAVVPDVAVPAAAK